MTHLDFHGTTYRYQTAGDPEREIGVIRGLGGTWIVGFLGTAGHHRIKSPRLPAGPDPDALQAALDEWAGERALPVASPGPQRTTAGQPQAGRDCRGVPPHPNAAGTATAGDGGADAAGSAGAPSVPAVVRAPEGSGESTTPRPPEALPQVLVSAERGIIPADLDACAELLRLCARVERVADNVRWMTIARAKDLLGDPSAWLAWVQQHYADYESRAHVHHMYAVGSLLLRECGHHTLFALRFDALLAISRLPPALLGPFLEKAHPQDRSRDDVRAAVNRWLAARGEPPADSAAGGAGARPGKPVQPAAGQPDFLDALFAAAEEPGTEFAERAAARAVGCTDALPVITRALVVVDSLIPRLDARRPEAFATLAQALRDEASRVEAHAAGLGPRLLQSPQE